MIDIEKTKQQLEDLRSQYRSLRDRYESTTSKSLKASLELDMKLIAARGKMLRISIDETLKKGGHQMSLSS